ncbi:PREDICTED: putative protein TPRXL [Camelina sativa]|uniref:Uncharacterized protein n=1 Tax=Camelina sativa TaxID=90675 RepID=A0ABM0ZBS1_CAMSA|nr:PREDICTED: putative protein TPRXL [Camelina sativa]
MKKKGKGKLDSNQGSVADEAGSSKSTKDPSPKSVVETQGTSVGLASASLSSVPVATSQPCSNLKIPVPKPRSLKKPTKSKSSPSSPTTTIATHNPYDVLAPPLSCPLPPNPSIPSSTPDINPPTPSSSSTDPISYMVIDSPIRNLQATGSGEIPPPSGGTPQRT